MAVLQEKSLLQGFLQKLNEKNIELLVNKLEAIDKKFLIGRETSDDIFVEISKQEREVDEFYSLWSTIWAESPILASTNKLRGLFREKLIAKLIV